MRNYGVVTLAGLCLLTIGCGRNSKREPVYPVSGTILYEGQPVAAADVTFFCAEKKRSAFGRTNAQGQYKLSTFAPNDGAVAGSHVIVITKFQTVAPTTLRGCDFLGTAGWSLFRVCGRRYKAQYEHS